MTFIPEDEARRRLKTPSNVLSRVNQEREEPAPIDLSDMFLPLDLDTSTPLDQNQEPTEGEAPLPPRDHPASNSLNSVPLEKQDEFYDPFRPLKEARWRDMGLDLKGRKDNIRNRTTEENAAVGLSSMLLGGTASEEMFGVPQSQQSLIKHGLTGSLDKKQGRAPKDELLESIYKHGQKASDLAFQKLFKTLELLTPEKLGNVTKAKDLAGIAVNMSRIVSAVTPKDSGPEQGGVHFHIYGPEQNRIEDYDTVEVRPDGSVIFEPGNEPPTSSSNQ